MSTVNIIIDQKSITAEEGERILDVALREGIFIPNLCHHPDLTPLGACGLCQVEIEGRQAPVASCKETVADGMVIHTDTAAVTKLRRLALELLMADHPNDCTGCPKYGSCPLQSMIQQISPSERARRVQKAEPQNETHPLFVRDMNRCIRCGRCVRACRELRGVKAIDYYRDEDQVVRVGGPFDLIQDSDCRSCCACVEVCPTGALRDKEETFVTKADSKRDMLVPCRLTCPAHTDVVRYLRYIREGRYGDAVAVIREKAPFPATLGYVCTHPCENACRRKFINDAVSIRNLKRFAAEHDDGAWKNRGYHLPATGEKVAVVGGGPSGLTAAYYLAKKGHSVTVFEELPTAGGMPRYGIPEYRLPRSVTEGEVALIQEAGVVIKTGEKITSLETLHENGFHAILLAIGAHEGTKLPIEGKDLPGVLMNIDFLRSARMDNPIAVGKMVVVLGGGNVAFDCARLALRSGALEVHIACLEARDKMTASDDEIEQGMEEGIILHPASTFVRITGSDRVTGIVLEKVESFTFDENRRAVIKTVPDSAMEIPADNIIFAVGQRPADSVRFGLKMIKGSYFAVQDGVKTSSEGVFACGDAVTGTKSVVEAIAGGRTAAEAIDRYLGGDGNISETLVDVDTPDPWIGTCEGFSKNPRHNEPALHAKERVRSCALVESAFDEDTAHCEADRCLQCDLRALMTVVQFRKDA